MSDTMDQRVVDVGPKDLGFEKATKPDGVRVRYTILQTPPILETAFLGFQVRGAIHICSIHLARASDWTTERIASTAWRAPRHTPLAPDPPARPPAPRRSTT
jgi:hypothetical protein